MKKLLILSSLILSFQSMAETGNRTYEVTLTNLTKGQPFTPPLLALSEETFNLYNLGNEATPGLKELARDGKTDPLKEELKVNMEVSSTLTGEGLIFPGKSQTFKFAAKQMNYLSLVTMLAKTNDAFTGGKNISLNLMMGESKTLFLNTYDAGAEINNELATYVPGLGAHDVTTKESEGFVHPHPGIYGIGDLNPLTDAFSAISAKVVIKRVK